MRAEAGSGSSRGDPIAIFTVRAERASSVVHRCPDVRAIVDLVVRLAGGGTVTISPAAAERHPDIAAALAGEIEVIRVETPADAARASVGVSVGEAIVVETGSVVVSEHALADRAVSMLSPVLVQVVSVEAILPTLAEAGALIASRTAGGRAGYHALITGPSRSADIERSLTVGVQGPAELHVALLGAAVEASPYDGADR